MKRKIVLLLTLFMMFPIFANGEQAVTEGGTMDDLYKFSSTDPEQLQKEIAMAVPLDNNVSYHISYNEEKDRFMVLVDVDGYYSIACEAQNKKDDADNVVVKGWVAIAEEWGVLAKRLYDSIAVVCPDSHVLVSILEDGTPGVSDELYEVDIDTMVDMLIYIDGELIMDVAEISN